MTKIRTPKKPFEGYKWRWATLTPTESLNDPPVFLGVLRVFDRFQHHAPSSQEVMDALAVVQRETGARVNLVRTRERNLVRNSGQYWRALGLLEASHGDIALSDLGRMLSKSDITQAEFAATIVKTLELPNRYIEENVADWDAAGLRIRPLQLLLDILAALSAKGAGDGWMTAEELIRVVIPLAGAKADTNDFVEAIRAHREGKLDLGAWPNCASDANDRRMAREFLLFLANYGLCSRTRLNGDRMTERFSLLNVSRDEITELHDLVVDRQDIVRAVKRIRETQIPAIIERKRVTREALERPYQSVFRKNVLSAFQSTCVMSGVDVEDVLEAAHIRPIAENGTDKVENGLCLRADIHQLFDSGHLRIFPDGRITLSDSAGKENNYKSLPRRITIPRFVNQGSLDWRVKYM